MWNASLCTLCGDCLVKCPYVEYDKPHAVTDIMLLMAGKGARILNECINCMACTEFCPTKADPWDLIVNMQEKLGTSPLYLEESVYLTNPIFKAPSGVTAGDPNKPIFAIGLTEPFLPDGAISGQMFAGLGMAKGAAYFGAVGMLRHCRPTLHRIYVEKFVNSLAALNRDILFLLDDCYITVTRKAKDYGINVPFRSIHLFEYLLSYLKEHRSNITKLNKKVAVQRPCTSRYSDGKFDLLDEILELIGVEQPKRKYDRENSLCCMSRKVGIDKAFPEVAAEFQGKNLQDAIEVGSDALLTICSGCFDTLKGPARRMGLPTIFITDLCRIALGEKPWEPSTGGDPDSPVPCAGDRESSPLTHIDLRE